MPIKIETGGSGTIVSGADRKAKSVAALQRMVHCYLTGIRLPNDDQADPADDLIAVRRLGSDKIWLVSFMNYDLGFFDHEAGRIANVENPFAAKVLPMFPV